MKHALAVLMYLLALGHIVPSAAQQHTLTYLVLADTVEPLMLASEADPMRGGIVTDTLKAVFARTNHQILPVVVPWQRTAVEQKARDNWIMYGMPSQCDPAEGCAASAEPIVDFNHVAVTLADSSLNIKTQEDLFGKRLLLVENFHYPGLDEFLNTPVDAGGKGLILDIRAFSPAGALRMLRHRRGDAFVDWHLRVLYNLAGAGLTPADVRISDASALVPGQKIHFFYSDKLPQSLRLFIDQRLNTLRTSGALQQIIDRYR